MSDIVDVLAHLDVPELLDLQARIEKRNQWLTVELALIEEALERKSPPLEQSGGPPGKETAGSDA